jgi:uncharacterized protein
VGKRISRTRRSPTKAADNPHSFVSVCDATAGVVIHEPLDGCANLGMASRVDLVVLQPTPFCNIDCSYCYLPDRDNRAVMSEATLINIFREVFACVSQPRKLSVLWHAGEPFVLPAQWYEKAFALIDELAPPGIVVLHCFQTNGTLLNEEWCRLLKWRQASIGISVDGPQEIHDAVRRTRKGTGSFTRVMAGIALLRAYHVEFSVLSVLTTRSLDAPKALFDFYDEIGVKKISFNFEEIEGIHKTSSLQAAGAVDSYKHFLRTFCVLVREKNKDWRIREIADIHGQMSSTHWENALNIPGRILSFDHCGNVSTFSPELLTMKDHTFGNFVIGNIRDGSIITMLNSEEARNIGREIARGVELCRSSCRYFDCCRGGAPSNKISENGSFNSTETVNCRFRIKATTDFILEELRNGIRAVITP